MQKLIEKKMPQEFKHITRIKDVRELVVDQTSTESDSKEVVDNDELRIFCGLT